MTEVNAYERINLYNNSELSLCVISEMKKNTQRPSKLLFKCQTFDEMEDRDRAYTRSYYLVAHLVNKHKLFPMNIRHNAP